MKDTFVISAAVISRDVNKNVVRSTPNNWIRNLQHLLRSICVLLVLGSIGGFSFVNVVIGYEWKVVLGCVAIACMVFGFTSTYRAQIKQGHLAIKLLPFGTIRTFSISSAQQLMIREVVDIRRLSPAIAAQTRVASFIVSESSLKEVQDAFDTNPYTQFIIEINGIEQFKFYLQNVANRQEFVQLIQMSGIPYSPVTESFERTLTILHTIEDKNEQANQLEREGMFLRY